MTAEPRHEHDGPGAAPPASGGRVVSFAVITVSDTRTSENDVSGKLARTILEAAGHRVALQSIVRDDAHAIREEISLALQDGAVEVVFLTGGTGISPRDTTPEAVEEILDKELPGFGELFRSLSLAEIGTATILSRAVGGVARGKGVFAAPGSRGAVKLALERILVPEAGHLVTELRKRGGKKGPRA